MIECNHKWISNSGEGGEPEFRLNPQIAHEPVMHIECERCGARTWVTKVQWYAIPPADEEG